MLGKTKVSFKQCYHKVQCVKDHYPESVVQESIVRSLKGAVADMAWYMGPTTSMAHILQKLTIIFGRVTDLEVQQQPKDRLFHGVCRHIRDSIMYLYSNPWTTYSQLMIAAHKAESENKEAHDKVRAEASITADPGEVPQNWGTRLPNGWLP